MSHEPTRIAILGAGFAALAEVHKLRKRSPKAINPLFSPGGNIFSLSSLIWVVLSTRLFHWAKRYVGQHSLHELSKRLTRAKGVA